MTGDSRITRPLSSLPDDAASVAGESHAAKAALRKALKTARGALDPAIKVQWDGHIGAQVIAWWRLRQIDTLGVYWPLAGEPDPHDEVEGCLSVPGESFPLRRGESATLTGLDVDGAEVRYEATGWFARMLQHEYDHLNGFLYVDRLDGEERREARRRMRAGEVDRAARRIGAARAAAVGSVFAAPAGTGAAR